MTEFQADREKIRTLIPSSIELLSLVEEGLLRIRAKPDDLFVVVSTFCLANSMRDWVKKERGLKKYWPDCPYDEAVREIANGTKHLRLDTGSHPELHVEDLSPEDTWEAVDWDELGSPVPMITLRARRTTTEGARWRSAKWVMEEVVDWWAMELNQPPKGYSAGH